MKHLVRFNCAACFVCLMRCDNHCAAWDVRSVATATSTATSTATTFTFSVTQIYVATWNLLIKFHYFWEIKIKFM